MLFLAKIFIPGSYSKVILREISMRGKKIPTGYKCIYKGPLATHISVLKRISLTTTTLAVTMFSIFIIGRKDDGKSKKLKSFFSGSFLLVTILSTFVLHLLTKGYVKRMHFSEDLVRFKIETNNILTFTKTIDFKPESVAFNCKKIFNNVEIDKKFYFIHLDHPAVQEAFKFMAEYKDLDKIQENESNEPTSLNK